MSIISSLTKKVSSVFKKPAVVAPKPLVVPKMTPAPMSKAPATPVVAGNLQSKLTSPVSKKTIYGSTALAALGGGAIGMSGNKPATPTFSKPVVPQVISQGPSQALRDMSISNSPTPSPTVPRVTPQAGGVPVTTPTPSTAPAPVTTPPVPNTGSNKKEKPNRPTAPVLTPEEKAVATAENLYQDSLKLSDDELATQGDLDRLSESVGKAYTGTKNQAIPMGFITGQLANIEERALNLAEPLENKLARMQAARTNAIESSKFALERADAKYKSAQESAEAAAKATAEASKPISIGGALVQKDPVTGEYKTVYQETASDKLLSPTEAAALGVPYGTTQSQAFGKSPVEKGDNLTPYQQFQATQAIQKTTQTNTDASRELNRQGSILEQTWNRYKNGEAGDLNATTQAIVTTFNKILDPTSVVRETEYDRSSAGQALISAIEGRIARISQGGPGLTPESLAELVDLGLTYSKNAQASIATANERARQQAEYFGLNPDFVTTSDYKAPSLQEYYQSNPTQQPKIEQIIRENPDLSDEDILQIVGMSFNAGGAGTNRPQRNNNPLNIKASENTKTYAGVVGTDPSPATDGGQFLVFDSPQAGFDAATRLLKTSGYLNLTVDGAMKRWSNNGYGGEVAPAIKNKTIASLTPAELQSLVDAMARREGYYA